MASTPRPDHTPSTPRRELGEEAALRTDSDRLGASGPRPSGNAAAGVATSQTRARAIGEAAGRRPGLAPSPASSPLGHHGGPCGGRRTCWRPGCRSVFLTYRTVEILAGGAVRAYCHRERYDAGDLIARLAVA